MMYKALIIICLCFNYISNYSSTIRNLINSKTCLTTLKNFFKTNHKLLNHCPGHDFKLFWCTAR